MTSSQNPIHKEKDLQIIGEKVLQLLFQFKDYSIVLTDTAGQILTWNSGAEDIYGYCSFEVIGRNIYEFYPEKDVRNGQPWMDLKMAKQNGRYEYEGWKHRKDETRFYAHTILTALYNPDTTLRGFAEVTRSITKPKEPEQE